MSIFSFFAKFFHKKPAAPSQPPSAPTTPPVVVTPVVVPPVAVAPAAPVAPTVVNPFVQWKADGKDLLWVQTWGLQRAMTDAEWAQAVAAGYTKDAGALASSAPASPALDFTPSVLDYNVIRGQNMIFTGGVSKTIINCPPTVTVKTIAPSNAVLKTPYTLTVNGVSRTQTVAVATTMISTQGPTVSIAVAQDSDSVVDLSIS